MNTLVELAEYYRVDKTPSIGHFYTDVYEALFDPIRQSVQSLLEIGIGTNELMQPLCGPSYVPGNSLRMWRDFFPQARIHGIDIEPSVLFTDERITTSLVNQSDPSSLSSLNSQYDIIIDDGSHQIEDILITFNALQTQVTRYYIIEDIRWHLVPQLPPEFKMHYGPSEWDNLAIWTVPALTT